MQKLLIALATAVGLAAWAATDIVPKPGDAGNLGNPTNAFPNIYGTNIIGALDGSNIVAGSVSSNALGATAIDLIAGAGGTGQTEWPYTAITNAPWRTRTFYDDAETNLLESIAGDHTLKWFGDTQNYWRFSDDLRADMFYGDGSYVTNLNGANIQAGTIASNALGATAIEFIQAAAGSATSPTALSLADTNCAVDFSAANMRTLALGTNCLFSAANLAAGKRITILITCDATTRGLYFPSEWKPLGTPAPGAIAASKVAELELLAWGTDATNVTIKYAEQP